MKLRGVGVERTERYRFVCLLTKPIPLPVRLIRITRVFLVSSFDTKDKTALLSSCKRRALAVPGIGQLVSKPAVEVLKGGFLGKAGSKSVLYLKRHPRPTGAHLSCQTRSDSQYWYQKTDQVINSSHTAILDPAFLLPMKRRRKFECLGWCRALSRRDQFFFFLSRRLGEKRTGCWIRWLPSDDVFLPLS